MKIKKLLSVVAIHLLISQPTFARATEEKDIKFMPSTEQLMKGEVHFALDLISPVNLEKKYPDMSHLDSLAFTLEPNVKIMIAKSAYVVNKPAGFFDHLNTKDLKYIAHIIGEQKVKSIDEHTFKITVPGTDGYSYYMRTYFDADDISTLPNSKVIRAVTHAKKLDVISGSASSSVFHEMNLYSKYSVGGVEVSSFIPLKENKTLVINYTMTAVKVAYANKKLLKENFGIEAEAQRNLINSYRPK